MAEPDVLKKTATKDKIIAPTNFDVKRFKMA